MTSDIVFYVIAGLAVALLGLSKGGFVGVGTISLPLMAVVMSPVAAAAILLPILIVQDVVGVWAFRRSWDARVLLIMVPGALVGIGLGYALAAQVSVQAVLAAVGTVSILFGGYRLWAARGGKVAAPSRGPDWVGALFGLASGFTSQLAHAGGPPYQIWVLPRQLARDIFIGTTAIFFALVNWAKVPAYIALGQFTGENLRITAMLLPVAILSTIAGVQLVRRVSADRFYTLIDILMVLVGAKLIADAF